MRTEETKSSKKAEAKGSSEGAISKDVLKKHVEKIQNLKKKAADANADIRSAFNAAEKDGVSKAALKDVLSILASDTNNDDHKATVNIYMEMLGKLPLFHFAATKH